MHVAVEQRINAPREVVWAALHDPDILRRCIPGCQSLERVSDTEVRAVATTIVGSIAATFKSRMTLSALEPPEACRFAGESHGGPAGFATGGAEVRLEPAGAASTLLKYAVDAASGDELAQRGGRLIDQSARKMTRDFFACLNNALSGSAPSPAPSVATEHNTAAEPAAAEPAAAEPAAAEPAAPLPESRSAAFWLPVTLFLITLVLYLMALI